MIKKVVLMRCVFSFVLVGFFAGTVISCASTGNSAGGHTASSGKTSSSEKTSPVKGKAPKARSIVKTEKGAVQGILSDDGMVEIFAGIPFAKPPVGDLRWKEPQELEPWDGVLAADHFAPMAMQVEFSRFANFLVNLYAHSKNDRTFKGPMSEDCLYLNVWRPSNIEAGVGDERLPVLVYIHGGSLTSGQSWYEKYDGTNLAREGIIVVTVAYRLGVFGYFADKELAAESPNGTTGNYGLLDQIKALEWVSKNIEAFGGDAGNITIAGESAGSSSVNAVCASPLAKGLFRRAIAESSSIVQKTPPHTFRTMKAALEMGANIKNEFKCSTVEELRKIPAEKLIKTKYKNSSMTVDGYALPRTPYEIYTDGQNNEEALLNGFNAREGFSFGAFNFPSKRNLHSLLESTFKDRTDQVIAAQNIRTNKDARDYYYDVYSAVCFTYPHDCWTRCLAAQGRPVYEYYFSKENGELGTLHSGEMIYAYRNVPRTKNYDQSDYDLEMIMSSYWLNFVKYGDPNGVILRSGFDAAGDGENEISKSSGLASNGAPLPEWKSFNESGLLLELGEKCVMREDPFKGIYEDFGE
jgi:para-nitrobenzyl esterase